MFLWVNLKKPQKTNLFATNMSYRLPTFKITSGVTNMHHYCGRVECIFLPQNNVLCVQAFLGLRFSKSRRLCRPVTFVNDDIMSSQ